MAASLLFVFTDMNACERLASVVLLYSASARRPDAIGRTTGQTAISVAPNSEA